MSLSADTTAWMALARDGSSALALRAASKASRGPWRILAAAALLAGGGAASWAFSGYPQPLADFWWRVGAVSLIALAFCEYVLCLACWRSFGPAEPLRRAWLFLALAAASRAAGLTVAGLSGGFGIDSSSLAAGGAARAAATGGLGVAFANPLTMGLAAAGLFLALKACRDAHLLRRPSPGEVALLAPLMLFLCVRFVASLRSLADTPAPASLLRGAGALVDPLFGLLLVQAVLLCRPVQQMGEGLIARCWGACISAVFLTAAAVLGNWATDAGYLPWQYNLFTSSAWLLAGTALALAPAHQLEAIVRARHPWLRDS